LIETELKALETIALKQQELGKDWQQIRIFIMKDLAQYGSKRERKQDECGAVTVRAWM
jgi:hypothetical protein